MLALLALQLFALSSWALYVAKGTPCSAACNSTGVTGEKSVVCSTDDFLDTAKGQTLQNCLECTIGSTYINSSYTDGNSDQFWTLWHMKYVQENCLVIKDTPHIAAVNACTSSCSPLTDVLKVAWILSHPFVGQYDYCTEDSSVYPSKAGDCARCLQGQAEAVILGNFVDTMDRACSSRPLAANGQLINPSRDLFATSVIVPSATTSGIIQKTGATTSSETSANSSTSTRSSKTTKSSTGTEDSSSTDAASPTTLVSSTDETATASATPDKGLSTAAAAGIGAGVAVLAVASIGGFVFMWLRKRATPPVPNALEHELTLHSPYTPINEAKPIPIIHEKSTDSQLHEAPAYDPRTSPVELPANSKG